MNWHSLGKSICNSRHQYYFTAPFLPTDSSHIHYRVLLSKPEKGERPSVVLLSPLCFCFQGSLLPDFEVQAYFGSKAKAAGSSSDSQIHFREYRAPLGPPILVSTITLYGTENSWPPIFFKLFGWGHESNYSLKELNWHFYHQDCGAVVKCPTISEEPSGTWCQLLIHRWQSLP